MTKHISPLEFGRKDAGTADNPELKAIIEKINGVTTETKRFAGEVVAKMKETGDLSAETKAKVDEQLMKFGEKATALDEQFKDAAARILDVEQKLARRTPNGEAGRGKTLGEMVLESEQLKKSGMTSASRMAVRVAMSRKDITSASGTVGAGASSSTSLVAADRVPGIVAPPQRRMTIRDLLMPGETAQGSIEYVVETGFTNSAGMVAEAATKPKSDIAFNLLTAPVRTIAHIFKASRQIMDDAPALRSYIDGRARYGLQFKEEAQLLNGDGTGQNILGLMPSATAYAAPTGTTTTGATSIDKLRIAMLQVFLAEYPSTGFVLNPIDWANMEMIKDAGGNYIIGRPQDGTQPRLWNLPVVETQAMAVNNYLTGAFNMAAQIFDRMEIEVLLSTENVDDFEKNMMTIRAEERLALAVYRPQAFVKGTL